jgi:cellulose synthase/poly-beta-1,6-N-acetylglucosamine synthase-like glycosyltransferase
MFLAIETILFYVLYVIQFFIAIHVLTPFIFYVFWIFNKNKRQFCFQDAETEKDIAVIITAYQETKQISDAVNSILKSNYYNYHIYVVADACPKDSVELNINHPKISILTPEHVIASNTGSHFYAIGHFQRKHEYLVIVDSDNLVHENMLKHLNNGFSQGFEAIQGVRAAKNLNSTYACLDAARDIYYHFYDGEVLFTLGSSATLAGSGMGFKVSLYQECLEKLNIKGAGFDKVLQYELLKRNKRIAFNKFAIIFDEKTSSTDQLVNQRSRWINTWFKYFKFGFFLIKKGLNPFNFNQLLFGLILLRPPLFIFLILSFVLFLFNFFFNPIIAIFWVISLLIYVVSFLIPIYQPSTDIRIKKALIAIPVFIYYQIISLFLSAKANKRSVATKHGFKQE